MAAISFFSKDTNVYAKFEEKILINDFFFPRRVAKSPCKTKVNRKLRLSFLCFLVDRSVGPVLGSVRRSHLQLTATMAAFFFFFLQCMLCAGIGVPLNCAVVHC